MNEEGKKLEEISAAVTRYYDSLTDEQVAEDRAWGELPLNLPRESFRRDATRLSSRHLVQRWPSACRSLAPAGNRQ
jgi:hypothetical protein